MFPSKPWRIQTCTSINLNFTVKTFSDYFSGAANKLKLFHIPWKVLHGDILGHPQDVQTSILHLITYLEDSY